MRDEGKSPINAGFLGIYKELRPVSRPYTEAITATQIRLS